MEMTSNRLLLVALSALVCASGFAQVKGKPLQNPQEGKKSTNGRQLQLISTETYEPTTIDTLTIYPQIQTEYSPRWNMPENPVELPGFAKSPGKLPLGEMLGFERVKPVTRFPGIGHTFWDPADPDLAVGPNHIVQVVNSSIAFFTKAGVKQFEQDSRNFFSAERITSFVFDPKVIYDQINDRFAIVYLDKGDAPRSSYILVAVSDDSDPNGTWHKYAIDVEVADPFNADNADTWLDYPGWGYNKDAYICSGNMFTWVELPRWRMAQFVSIRSAGPLSGGTATVDKFVDNGSASMQVASVYDPTESRGFSGGKISSNTASLVAFTNLASSPSAFREYVAIPASSSPGSAPSTGGIFLDSVGGRCFNLAWQPGNLAFAHAFDNSGQIDLRWYEFNTGTWPTSGLPTYNQGGSVTSSTIYYVQPAINYNAFGDMAMIFTGSNTSTTSNIYTAGRTACDPVGSFGSPTFMKSSIGPNYTGHGSTARWGDYFGVERDPVDGYSFWGNATYIGAQAATTPWLTEIVNFKVSDVLAPASGVWNPGTAVSGGVGDLAADDDVYMVGQPGPVLQAGTPPCQVTFTAVVPGGTSHYRVQATSKASSLNIEQTLWLWNYNTNSWDAIGSPMALSTTESSMFTACPGTPGDYIQGGTNQIRAKLTHKQTGPVLAIPWKVSIDQFRFVYH